MIAAFAHALMKLTVVDGELVAFDEDGRPSFNAMQNSEPETRVVFFVFDVLIDQRIHVKGLPLSDRRSVLESAVIFSDLVQHWECFSGSLDKFFSAVQKIGEEGVIEKRLSSRYEPGKRTGAWRKKRITMGQEFVIGGFTPGSHGVDAVIVGYNEGKLLKSMSRGSGPASCRRPDARYRDCLNHSSRVSARSRIFPSGALAGGVKGLRPRR